MGNHRNHGNRQPVIPGFRPGKAPAIVSRPRAVTYKMGFSLDDGLVLVEWTQPVANLQMTPEQVDELTGNLQAAKRALLEARANENKAQQA